MMNRMKHILYICLAILMCSCSHYKWLTNNPQEGCKVCPTKDSVIITRSDTVIVTDSITFIEPDSATLRMFFECDSMNNVLVRMVDGSTGKQIVYKYIFKDNILELNISTDSIAVLNRIIDHLRVDKREVVKYVTQEKIVHSGVFYVWFFYIFLLLLSFLIGWKVFNWYLKIRSGGVVKG